MLLMIQLVGGGAPVRHAHLFALETITGIFDGASHRS